MKKVIFEDIEEVVNVKDLNRSDIIGVQFKETGSKGQVIKVRQDIWIISKPGDRNDFSFKIEGTSIQKLLAKLSSPLSVFVFDNQKEFLNWISE